MTLGDIHNAVGAPALLAMGNRTESPGCIVEQAVNAALDGVCEEAEALLLRRFNSITLADLSKDFHRRMTGGGFGGCTVNMMRPDAVDAFGTRITRAYEERFGVTPQIYPVRPSAGASEIQQAN